MSMFAIELDRETKQKLKIKAAQEHKSLKQIGAELIQNYLKQDKTLKLKGRKKDE